MDEKRREYYLKNKDRIKENRKKWYDENRDKINEKRREYYSKNKDWINARRYAAENLKRKQKMQSEKDDTTEEEKAKIEENKEF